MNNDNLNNTWEKIKSLSNDGDGGEDPILKQVGIDTDMLKELEESTVKSAMEEVKVKVGFVNHSNNPNPSHKYLDDSGMDLRANLDTPTIINPGKVSLIPTGLHFELPESYEIQVRPRSGLAAKFGITVLNTPGTVDRGYTGEIKVILINLGESDFKVSNGDRIAQAVVSPVISGRWCKLTENKNINTTSRGDGGFGSTGIK